MTVPLAVAATTLASISQVTVACATTNFILAYVPVFCKGPLLFARASSAAKMSIGELNLNPREALTRTIAVVGAEDAAYLARCQSCHDNCLEGLPWLYAALLFAAAAGVPSLNVDAVALYNAVARALYVFFYVRGTSEFFAHCRTFCFWSSWISCLYLFITACVVAPPKTWT